MRGRLRPRFEHPVPLIGIGIRVREDPGKGGRPELQCFRVLQQFLESQPESVPDV